MRVVKTLSHKGGAEFITERFTEELREIYTAVELCDAEACLSKISKEKTKAPLLFSPVKMNDSIKSFLCKKGWTKAAPNSKKGFQEHRIGFGNGRFREMDGIKNKVGLEIQFGKYAFMGYDMFSKMPIFHKKGLITCGIELVAMPELVSEMSTGVSSFDQIAVDIRERGEADIDIPTLVIGISWTDEEWVRCVEKRRRFESNSSAMINSGEVSKGFDGASPGPKADMEYAD